MEQLNFQLILVSFKLIVPCLHVRDLFERKIPARHFMPENMRVTFPVNKCRSGFSFVCDAL